MTTSLVHEGQTTSETTTMKKQIIVPLKERRPRIIVEVNESDAKIPGMDYGSGSSSRGSEKVLSTTLTRQQVQRDMKIDILNASSLVFHMKHNTPQETCRRTLHFDCVARGDNDQLVRWQMSSLVDHLLTAGRHNCCLLRISPTRSLPTLQILSHILIPEINKRLGTPEISPLLLYAIRLEYYDVRKYDVVNMVLRAAPKNRPRHQITFRNTWELLHWVQETYPSLWSLGAGHECLDLKLVFVRDRSGAKVRVKLSMVQFYMNKMDADMSAGLRNFLENAGANNSTRIKHSILTDYLREYFFSPENWHIWMIFNIYANKSGSIVNEMLTMASAAFAGARNLIDDTPTSEMPIFEKPNLDSEFLTPVIRCTQSSTDNRTAIKCSASNTAAQIALKFRKKEKQSLSYWYRQMDEKFINVILNMENYYSRKNKVNKPECSGDSKPAPKKKERKEFITTVRNTTPKEMVHSQPCDYAMHTVSLSYKQAVDSLHALIQQIERSPYARQLRALIQMKNAELMDHLKNIQEDSATQKSTLKLTEEEINNESSKPSKKKKL